LVNLLPIQIKGNPNVRPIEVISNSIPTNFLDREPFTNGWMIKAPTINRETLKNPFS